MGSSGGQPEEDPVLVCDTSTPGTRYYVCYVMTKLGGWAYSSVIPVTVTEKTVVTQPPSGGSEGPAATLPAGSETSPAGSGGHTGTDRVPGEKDGSRGTVIIVLAAVCGVLLGSCIALAAAAFRKKK